MVEISQSLTDAVQRYDRQADHANVKVAEDERDEVLRLFPRAKWPQLTLDRYALGLGNKEDSFCWWLEFGASHVGSMKGGTARKHIIYRQRSGEWFFDRKKYKSEQEAWIGVRSGFLKAFAAAEAGDWDQIDEIEEISWGPALRTKALHCYFMAELLPICSLAHIKHFLEMLGVLEEVDTRGYDVVRLNRYLLQALRSRSEFSGWSTLELSRFLYLWADPRDQRQIVKIAPGEDAKYWKDCFDNNYICVGWDDLGDLELFESKESFKAAFDDNYLEHYRNSRSTTSRKANEVWTLRELEPGDLIVANKGTSRVLAVGTVVEPGYQWRPERVEYKNVVSVQWDTKFARDISPQKAWAMATVAPVSQALAALILSGDKSTPPPAVPVDSIYKELESALERKGQAVLYGPPGTGKTHHARRFAVWWLHKKLNLPAADVLTNSAAFTVAENRLSTTQVGRKVWWIVANPKEWSWDRLFKDGQVEYRYGRLQKNYPLVRKGDLVVGYQSTPDKCIVALARVQREMIVGSDGTPTIQLEPITAVAQGPTYEELLKEPLLKTSEPMRHRCQGTLFGLSEEEFEQLSAWLIERDPKLRSHLEAGESVGPLTRLTFHASYSYEDFVEGFRPSATGNGQLSLHLEDGVFKRVCRQAQADPKNPYLVLIDEINRANVAKVFGELITLLERDKRNLLICLPQSKETFTVPPNVYLVGTMNTADRSIKLLDAALRRRFAFLELMPKSALLQGGKIGNLALDDFLDELNRRVAAKEGREKQIGHSFLLEDGLPVSDPHEFARRFRQEILPLLQEYCYEDYRVLAHYIGDKLVNQEAQMLDEERLADPDRLLEALEASFVEPGIQT